jgi:hypothetical protein
MTSVAELNDIALTLLQATGLLLPVVFLTINFVKNEGFGDLPEYIQERIAILFLLMIGALTATGFLATIGVFESPAKSLVLFIAVCSLAIFFVLYGFFIYYLIQ